MVDGRNISFQGNIYVRGRTCVVDVTDDLLRYLLSKWHHLPAIYLFCIDISLVSCMFSQFMNRIPSRVQVMNYLPHVPRGCDVTDESES
jgi:hypothetical protein